MSPADQPEKRKALIEEGFCVFESILNEEMLSRVTCASNRLLDAQDKEHFEKQKSTGSLICVYDDPFFADLVGWQPALDALNSLGYVAPKFSTGFVISKPPHSPPLFWHQDWWGWEHPHSYTPNPQQIFLMYYLVDTTPKNGCLRLIPGSHLHRHPLHDISEAHTEEIRLAEDVTSPAYLDHPDEMDVCVKAGDVVMGDSRLLPVKPKVLLMDEPCSALDPKGTEAVEELIWELRGQYTILIVTHNMAQARRASEECIFYAAGQSDRTQPN